MRVFLYEAITGGGWFRMGPGEPLSASLLSEGRAMARALRDDLLRIPDCEVLTLADARADEDGCPWWRVGLEDEAARIVGDSVGDVHEHDDRFERAVRASTAVILVAPELGGMLTDLAKRARGFGGNLHSPSPEFVELTSDKSRLAAFFAAAGVPMPTSHRLTAQAWEREDWDAIVATAPTWILKPNDGAGSSGIQRCAADRWREVAGRAIASCPEQVWCLQEFRAGKAASVAAIVDDTRRLLLPPCWQILDGRTFAYRGGGLIEEESWAERAWCLAERALSALPATRGYVGIDLVLSEHAGDGRDAVIEVNPRLTTSYVGLRRAVSCNLARLMLEGLDMATPRTCRRQASVQFDAEGRVTVTASSGASDAGRAEDT